MTFVSYSDASKIADKFLELLQNNNIDPPVKSELEIEMLSLTNLVEIYEKPELIQNQNDYDKILVAAAGIHDLAAKILSVKSFPEFKEFIPHLKLINCKNFKSSTSVGQNSPNSYDDDTARKFAELYIGCLAAHCGEDIDLDDPVNSKGDNPDVMLKYKSRKWALAIKSISTRQGETIFQRIKEGVEQIEKSAAEIGMVVINCKSAINHENIIKPNQAFISEDEAIIALKLEIMNLIDLLNKDRSQSEWTELFNGKKAIIPILFMAQSLAKIPTQYSEKNPTALKMLMPYCANLSPDSDGVELAYCMNHFAQDIVKNGDPLLTQNTATIRQE